MEGAERRPSGLTEGSRTLAEDGVRRGDYGAADTSAGPQNPLNSQQRNPQPPCQCPGQARRVRLENGESPDGAARCSPSCEGSPEPRATQARRTAGLRGAGSWVFYGGSPFSATATGSLPHSGDLREAGSTSQTPMMLLVPPSVGPPCTQPSEHSGGGWRRGCTRSWRGLVLGKRHWGRGAERGLGPGGSNPSNGFQGSRGPARLPGGG